MILNLKTDDTFVTGKATKKDGRFIIENVNLGSYNLKILSIRFVTYHESVFYSKLIRFYRFKNYFTKNVNAQLTASYLAPDIIPQGKIKSMFSLDLRLKKSIQKGRD